MIQGIPAPVRLGTRGSDLALAQAQLVSDLLNAQGIAVEREIIRTAGDQSDAPTFAQIGPQGVFVREIEQALLDGRIDIAVHSFKDLPTHSPEGLVVGAVPTREDPADVLLIRDQWLATDDRLMPLRHGARIGTASARRRAWIKHFRSDLEVESLRGNVPTRIGRLKDGDYDAILLAAAGVARLREQTDVLEALLEGLTLVRLDPLRFVPAPAQGALAIQCRRDDTRVTEALAALDHAPSRTAVTAERALLAFGAHCRAAAEGFELVAMLERGGRVLTARAAGADPHGLAAQAWDALRASA
jgi:hydroxymethylbilane synthase